MLDVCWQAITKGISQENCSADHGFLTLKWPFGKHEKSMVERPLTTIGTTQRIDDYTHNETLKGT